MTSSPVSSYVSEPGRYLCRRAEPKRRLASRSSGAQTSRHSAWSSHACRRPEGGANELADRSGLARRTLIEIEQGRTIGTLKTWHALAHALSTPLDELFATLCNGHKAPEKTDG
jgi:DNA-binding XRE family transcriptional regulator